MTRHMWTAAALWLLVAPLSAQAPGPVIERVRVDLRAETLTITGHGLGSDPVVLLEDRAVPIVSASDTEIVVQVAGGVLAQAGNSRLTLMDRSTGTGEAFIVTLGAAATAVVPAGTGSSGMAPPTAARSGTPTAAVGAGAATTSPAVTESDNGTTAVGYQALNSVTTGTLNTALGSQSLFSTTTGAQNTATGYQTLYFNVSGVGNTATGLQALANSTTASYNVAHGHKALFALTSGWRNTATGYQALSATRGQSNTAVGNRASAKNVFGEFNTAVGDEAMSYGYPSMSYNHMTYNTAVGYQSLSQTTNSWNTTIGARSGTWGHPFTAVGYESNGGTTLGSQALSLGGFGLDGFGCCVTDGFGGSVALGYRAMSGDNTAAVGSYAMADARYPYANNTAVGMGALWNVQGHDNVAMGDYAGYELFGLSDGNIHVANRGQLRDTGVTRIGTAQAKTFLAGIRGTTTSVNDAVTAVIDSRGQLGTVSSSRRVKQGISDMGDASSPVLRLRPVTFQYRRPYANGTHPMQYGLIAEEVAEIMPDLVAYDAGRPETVKYHVLSSLLLNEVQRQQRTIKALRESLADLEAALAAGR